MKLFYDMLVPYMPDSTKDSEGKLNPDSKKAAGRDAMIDLSNFQQSGNITSLYHSIISACIYSGNDLVDVILNMPEDVEVPDGSPIDKILDDSAKLLFSSIKDINGFNIYVYTCNLLTVAHTLLVARAENSAEREVKEA